jgi:hypothetical protein
MMAFGGIPISLIAMNDSNVEAVRPQSACLISALGNVWQWAEQRFRSGILQEAAVTKSVSLVSEKKRSHSASKDRTSFSSPLPHHLSKLGLFAVISLLKSHQTDESAFHEFNNGVSPLFPHSIVSAGRRSHRPSEM